MDFAIAIVAEGRITRGRSVDVGVTTAYFKGYTICASCVVVVLIAMDGSCGGGSRGWVERVLVLSRNTGRRRSLSSLLAAFRLTAIYNARSVGGTGEYANLLNTHTTR